MIPMLVTNHNVPNIRSGYELLATLADGRIVKWDTRCSSDPVITIDINVDLNADQPKHGATSVCYDPSVPHRYKIRLFFNDG